MTEQLYDIEGNVVGQIELNDAVFAAPVHAQAVHQLLKREQANARVGTASSLTRGQVEGSTAKPWKQKGTGNARAGHKRSPLWRKGGVIFGPHPRSYSQSVPRKVRKLAYRSLFSLKGQQQSLRVVQDFALESGKTQDLAQVVSKLRMSEKGRVVLVCAHSARSLVLASRNLANFELLNYQRLSCQALLYASTVVVTEEAAKALPAFLSVEEVKA